MERTGNSAKNFLYHVNFLINQKEIASEQIIKDTTKSLILAQDER